MLSAKEALKLTKSNTLTADCILRCEKLIKQACYEGKYSIYIPASELTDLALKTLKEYGYTLSFAKGSGDLHGFDEWRISWLDQDKE